MPDRRWICVAAISGAQGLRGAVRVLPFTTEPQALERFAALHLGEGGPTVSLRLERPLKRGWVARLAGIDTREAAEGLKGRKLFVPREALGDTADEDSYFCVDLVGLDVHDPGGGPLGRIADVPDYGAGSLVEIALAEPVAGFGKTVLVPFTRDYVPEIDLAAGRAVVDLAAWLDRQAESKAR